MRDDPSRQFLPPHRWTGPAGHAEVLTRVGGPLVSVEAAEPGEEALGPSDSAVDGKTLIAIEEGALPLVEWPGRRETTKAGPVGPAFVLCRGGGI